MCLKTRYLDLDLKRSFGHCSALHPPRHWAYQVFEPKGVKLPKYAAGTYRCHKLSLQGGRMKRFFLVIYTWSYPLVIKHGWKITYKWRLWSILHCHVWSPEGIWCAASSHDGGFTESQWEILVWCVLIGRFLAVFFDQWVLPDLSI